MCFFSLQFSLNLGDYKIFTWFKNQNFIIKAPFHFVFCIFFILPLFLFAETSKFKHKCAYTHIFTLSYLYKYVQVIYSILYLFYLVICHGGHSVWYCISKGSSEICLTCLWIIISLKIYRVC